MIARKRILDKRGIAINKLLTLVLVAFVVVIVMVFLYKIGILKTLRNILPSFGGDDMDGIGEEGGGGGAGAGGGIGEGISKCVVDAYWADDTQKRIKAEGEVGPPYVFFALKVDDVEKCSHNIIFKTNVARAIPRIPFDKKLLEEDWTKKNDVYFRRYEVEDAGWSFWKSGEYYFHIEDSSGKKVFLGYRIEIEEPGWKR